MLRVVGNGRVAGEPEITRYEDSGRKIANFSIAVRKKYPKDGGPTADFFRCVAFGEKVDFIEEYIKKGMMIIVFGRLENSIYTNKNDEQVTRTQIVIDDIEFGESKKSFEERRANEKESDSPEDKGGDQTSGIDEDDIPDDELPF